MLYRCLYVVRVCGLPKLHVLYLWVVILLKPIFKLFPAVLFILINDFCNAFNNISVFYYIIYLNVLDLSLLSDHCPVKG